MYSLIWAYDQQADGGPFCVTGPYLACIKLRHILELSKGPSKEELDGGLSYIEIRNCMDGEILHPLLTKGGVF